jgi:hypothetical protein
MAFAIARLRNVAALTSRLHSASFPRVFNSLFGTMSAPAAAFGSVESSRYGVTFTPVPRVNGIAQVSVGLASDVAVESNAASSGSSCSTGNSSAADSSCSSCSNTACANNASDSSSASTSTASKPTHLKLVTREQAVAAAMAHSGGRQPAADDAQVSFICPFPVLSNCMNLHRRQQYFKYRSCSSQS